MSITPVIPRSNVSTQDPPSSTTCVETTPSVLEHSTPSASEYHAAYVSGHLSPYATEYPSLKQYAALYTVDP